MALLKLQSDSVPTDATGVLRGRVGILIPVQWMRKLRPPWVGAHQEPVAHPPLSSDSCVLTSQPLNEALEDVLHLFYKRHTINLKQHVNSGLSLQQDGFG